MNINKPDYQFIEDGYRYEYFIDIKCILIRKIIPSIMRSLEIILYEEYFPCGFLKENINGFSSVSLSRAAINSLIRLYKLKAFQ